MPAQPTPLKQFIPERRGNKLLLVTANPVEKIPGPIFLPTPPRPEPQAYKVPRMGNIDQGQVPIRESWPVTEAELGEICSWGVPLFQKRYPRLTREAAEPFLRGCIYDPNAFLVRTETAVGLAYVERTVWEPLPRVIEFGVVAKSPSAKNTLRIYRAMEEWARSLKAVEFHFGSDTGVNLEPFAHKLGAQTYCQLFIKTLEY